MSSLITKPILWSIFSYALNIYDLLNKDNDKASLKMNDIGHISIKLQHPIVAQEYKKNRVAGAFILIDDTTKQTVAAGMIDHFSADEIFATHT